MYEALYPRIPILTPAPAPFRDTSGRGSGKGFKKHRPVSNSYDRQLAWYRLMFESDWMTLWKLEHFCL